ncbi:MAG: hypothetical protein HUU06_04810 [Planctomycetaceae bacterium]|nr:hypothetical protein [Planctomycetota bacterium]NUN52099.1 hypothetical protein [Planctomycetaceae bacterium]
MARPWKVLGLGAIVVGLLVLPGVWVVDRTAGRDLLVVEAHAQDVVELNRALWEQDKEGVPAIYGTPRTVERLAFVPEGKVVKPAEDPSLEMYLKRGDDHPLQVQTLWYFGVPTAVGGVLTGLGFLLLARRKGS